MEEANEFKGSAKLNILFPFELIPGLETILPKFEIGCDAGFFWHNDEDQHRYEMDKILATGAATSEKINVQKLFLDALRSSASVQPAKDGKGGG